MAGDGTATVLTVRVERDTLDGGFIVSAAEASGCVSQGETITAALENFADAFTGWAIARAMRPFRVVEVGEALRLVCEVAFAWASEYGFSQSERAAEVWAAAKLLRPELEPTRG